MSQGTCITDPSHGQVLARGWCRRCYRNWSAYGDPRGKDAPGARRLHRLTEKVQRRFWCRAQMPDSNGCILWTGSKLPNGYGSFDDGAGAIPAHAYSWVLAYGEPPGGELTDLDHLCRVHNCVAPDHLEWVTHAENSRRANVQDACQRGHRWDEQKPIIGANGSRSCRACQADREAKYRAARIAARAPRVRNTARGERSGSAKLTDEIVRQIRAADGPYQAIADRFGIDTARVSRIKTRKIWKHVE